MDRRLGGGLQPAPDDLPCLELEARDRHDDQDRADADHSYALYTEPGAGGGAEGAVAAEDGHNEPAGNQLCDILKAAGDVPLARAVDPYRFRIESGESTQNKQESVEGEKDAEQVNQRLLLSEAQRESRLDHPVSPSSHCRGFTHWAVKS